MESHNFSHVPVLLEEFIANTNVHFSSDPYPPKIWDGTLGLGGHLSRWLETYPTGTAYTNDCDSKLLQYTKEHIQKKFYSRNIAFSHSNFAENPFAKYAPFDTILLDLGVSSIHIDSFSRGISFRDGKQILDMRLDSQNGMPLYEWLQQASLQEIHTILKTYGEEKYSHAIAKAIVKHREEQPIYYTRDLKNICISVYQKLQPAYLYSHIYTIRNPYVKTFQAFRIHTNQELHNLQKTLDFAPHLLKPKGRLFIISFHSLEDRMVKKAFHNLIYIRDHSEFAKSYYKESEFFIPSKKPIIPTKKEMDENPRSHSAKMRILERCFF